MATTTPNYGWDVPTSTDYVKDGATAIETLGDDIDATLFSITSGKNVGMVLLSTTTLSAVSSQSFTSVFSATYKNYIINFNLTGGAGVNLNFRLRSGSTDQTGANYSYGAFLQQFSGLTLSSDAASTTATSWPMGFASSEFDMEAKLFNPFGSTRTKYQSQMASDVSTGREFYFGGHYNATTSFDGFTIFPSSGTLTGTVSLYGIAK